MSKGGGGGGGDAQLGLHLKTQPIYGSWDWHSWIYVCIYWLIDCTFKFKSSVLPADALYLSTGMQNNYFDFAIYVPKSFRYFL